MNLLAGLCDEYGIFRGLQSGPETAKRFPVLIDNKGEQVYHLRGNSLCYGNVSDSVPYRFQFKGVVVMTGRRIVIASALFYLLVPFAFATYRIGGPFIIPVYLIAILVASVIIWVVSNRWWMVLLVGGNFVTAISLYVILATYLYYINFSSDVMTMVAGFAIAWNGAWVASSILGVMTLAKVIALRK
ncbi:MAG: hypothetical protein J5921_05135 [Clostridia bacterium]|nr:hypothetical protein [Clostridia bacterium]